MTGSTRSSIGFTLISDPRVTSIEVIDVGEPLVEVVEGSGLRLSSKRSGHGGSHSLVRARVYSMLQRAQRRLPRGVHLMIEEGHRSMCAQRKTFDSYVADLRRSMPSLSEEALCEEATKYVAMPQGHPPHSTGGAVDVCLTDWNGYELDMGSTSDDRPLANGDANFTHASGLSRQATANRELLRRAMIMAGFVNYPAEWWHWSFGDQYWALQCGRSYAIYGTLDP